MPYVRLQSSDGEIFETEEHIAKSCGTIKTMLEDCGMDRNETTIIPLPNVNSTILRKVFEYAEYHKNDPVLPDGEETMEKRTDDISIWDSKFLELDQATIFELILAANYLDVKGLMAAACKTVAIMIKGKTSDEIRKTFDKNNDFIVGKEVEKEKDGDSE